MEGGKRPQAPGPSPADAGNGVRLTRAYTQCCRSVPYPFPKTRVQAVDSHTMTTKRRNRTTAVTRHAIARVNRRQVQLGLRPHRQCCVSKKEVTIVMPLILEIQRSEGEQRDMWARTKRDWNTHKRSADSSLYAKKTTNTNWNNNAPRQRLINLTRGIEQDRT